MNVKIFIKFIFVFVCNFNKTVQFTIVSKHNFLFFFRKAIDFLCEQMKKDLLLVKVETVTYIKALQVQST